jgi:predicted GNAT family N-acyltransferase
VQYALKKLKAYPISSLEVWTSQYADRFFAKYGFATESVIKNYWADGIHLHKMVKNPYK